MDEHLSQRSFRIILEAMTFPGKITQLEQSPTDVPALYSQTILVCQTLLDSEVTFAVITDCEASQSIHAYTGSHEAKVEEADFIIVPQNVSSKELSQLKWVKTGDLRDPQKSATLFIEVDSLTDGKSIELRGPGIKEKTIVHSNISTEFLETRATLNGEYPLGIDTILIDQDGQILALPRTTKVTEVK